MDNIMASWDILSEREKSFPSSISDATPEVALRHKSLVNVSVWDNPHAGRDVRNQRPSREGRPSGSTLLLNCVF